MTNDDEKQFLWTLRAPHVPDDYPYQRYFQTSDSHYVAGMLSVYRNGRTDAGELQFLSGRVESVSVSATLFLTAAECRELAQTLLNAAHDLDVNPSSSLVPLIREQEARNRAQAGLPPVELPSWADSSLDEEPEPRP